MTRRLVLGIVVVALAGTAHASPRNKTTAQALSGLGIAASGVLFASAFVMTQRDGDVHMPLLYAGLGSSVITPSLGYFYVGEYLTLGLGIRAAAAGLATFAVLQYTQPVRCHGVAYDTSCKGLEREAIALLGVSAIAFVGGAAYDMKELAGTVDDHNRRHGITLAPTVIRSSAGAPGAGLVLAGSW